MQHRPQLVVRLGLAVALGAGAVACSGGDDAGPVTAALERVPLSTSDAEDGAPQQWSGVTFTDFARAAEVAGLLPPAADRTADAALDLVIAVSQPQAEPGEPYVFFPVNIDRQGWLEPEAIRDETGIWLPAVETITEAGGFPQQFTVVTGDLELGGELVEDGDLLRAGEGDDVPFGDPSVFRPIGRTWYLAERDGAIGMSFLAAAVDDWRSDGETLADDESLAALAAALDGFDPYTALLTSGAFNHVPRPSLLTDPDEVADEVEAQEALIPDIGPFSHIAIAEFADDDGAPRTLVAYLFADEQTADDAIEPLRAAWLDLQTFGDEDDISDTVSAVSVTTDGSVVVLELDADGSSSTRRAITLFSRAEPVFSYLLS